MLMKTATVVAVFGLLCAWMQVLTPPGKLKKTVTFAFGVTLCAFAVKQIAGTVSFDLTALWRQTRSDTAIVEETEAAAGGAYAQQIVESLAGADANCKTITDSGGEIRSFRVRLPDDGDVFSQSQTRRRITQALCGIYDIEPDAVVFF